MDSLQALKKKRRIPKKNSTACSPPKESKGFRTSKSGLQGFRLHQGGRNPLRLTSQAQPVSDTCMRLPIAPAQPTRTLKPKTTLNQKDYNTSAPQDPQNNRIFFFCYAGEPATPARLAYLHRSQEELCPPRKFNFGGSEVSVTSDDPRAVAGARVVIASQVCTHRYIHTYIHTDMYVFSFLLTAALSLPRSIQALRSSASSWAKLACWYATCEPFFFSQPASGYRTDESGVPERGPINAPLIC